MEELAIKIAETLDISVQAAIDMYPVIRSQFTWYLVLDNINTWAVLLMFVSIMLTGVTLFIRFDLDKYNCRTEEINEDWVAVDKVFKKAFLLLLLSVVVAITTDMIIPFLAPDILLIKNFLG
ncbi:hypothetical protein [Jeotgalibaca porci]|uniref:hypothetical protein n=1 Tax=Jeotgalibaca porci TaxID=1868793 RepID=UPI0035A0744D